MVLLLGLGLVGECLLRGVNKVFGGKVQRLV